MPENNFLVFNEEQDEEMTMSDADYLASEYRTGGVVRGIADPVIHNKMYLQWSTMAKAVADMISSKGYDATDESAADLKNSLISAISDIAEEAGGGGGASDSKERKASTAYALEDIATVSTFKSYKYLECVKAGTSGTGNLTERDVGQLITDGGVIWLVCDMRDASPVASIKYDYSVRLGWVKCNGSTLSGNSYPRLLNYLKNNNLATTIQNSSLSDATDTARQYHDNNPGKFYLAHGTTLDEYNIILPDFTGRFIEGADSAGMTVAAGLPNITGYVEADAFGVGGVLSGSNGVFSLTNKQQVYATTVTTEVPQVTRYRRSNFSASNSNQIYGRSTTVQPPTIQMIPLIKY